MIFRLIQLIILTIFSIFSIVLYGCSTSNHAFMVKKKFHVYECKNEKLIYCLSDSTKLVIYPKPTQDETILKLIENGILTVSILADAYKNEHNWYEFDAAQAEIVKTSSDTCSDKIDENTVFVQYSSSEIDSDGSTLHNIEYFIGGRGELYCFELKQIKQDHYAIRFSGFIF